MAWPTHSCTRAMSAGWSLVDMMACRTSSTHCRGWTLSTMRRRLNMLAVVRMRFPSYLGGIISTVSNRGVSKQEDISFPIPYLSLSTLGSSLFCVVVSTDAAVMV